MKRRTRVLFLTLITALFMSGCANGEQSEKEEGKEPPKQSETTEKEDTRISLAAVGDNLIHGAIYLSSDYQVNGSYDFTSIYAQLKSFLVDYDIANINQETVLGGTQLGLSHYPSFNSPQEIGDAIADAGFNWVSQASNHSLDAGAAGIISAMDFWDRYPDVVTTGINRSEEEAARPRIMEVKGVKVGLLNYSYGFNGYVEPEDFYCNEIDKAKIKKDYEQLKEAGCIVVLASMHWGQEYQFSSNEEQRELAQFLADLGVNVIIGAHPHVVQETTFLTGKNGNQTLVNYSLGNILSAQDENYTMLGALMTCEIVIDGSSNEVTIEQAKVYPTVNYYEAYGGSWHNFQIYLLRDYNDTLASTHAVANTTVAYLNDLCDQVYGEVKDIEIVR